MSKMTFDEYQEFVATVKRYPQQYNVLYPALGLCGEAGEVAEKVKKLIRDGDESGNFENALASELGDVLWYLSNLASEIGMTLEEIATINTQKLQDRKSR